MTTITVTLTDRQLRALTYAVAQLNAPDNGTRSVAYLVQKRLSEALAPDEANYLQAAQAQAATAPDLEPLLGTFLIADDAHKAELVKAAIDATAPLIKLQNG